MLYIFWIVCGFISLGFETAFFSRHDSEKYNKYSYIAGAIISFAGGPVALFLDVFLLEGLMHGWTIWPWREVKLRRVELKLDGN